MIKFSIDLSVFSKMFNRSIRSMKSEVIATMEKQSKRLAEAIKRKYLSGGTNAMGTGGTFWTSSQLKIRSGELRKQTVPLPTTTKRSLVEGGVEFKAPYSGLHIGVGKKTTTIRPKHGSFLAIPLDGSPAVNARGAYKGDRNVSIRSQFPFLKAIKSPLWKYPMLVKTQNNGKFVPYFVLCKQVRVPRRVDLDEVTKFYEQDITNEFVKAILRSK